MRDFERKVLKRILRYKIAEITEIWDKVILLAATPLT
jgi:hypothetical protein